MLYLWFQLLGGNSKCCAPICTLYILQKIIPILSHRRIQNSRLVYGTFFQMLISNSLIVDRYFMDNHFERISILDVSRLCVTMRWMVFC